jgi:ribonuclease HII
VDDKEIVKIENELWEKGFKRVAGIDEAGRGPLAGPVVAAAVVFPPFTSPFIFKDSKKLKQLERETLFKKIVSNCLDFGIGISDSKEIDRINILEATKLAMKRAIRKLKREPDFIITDAVHLEGFKNQLNLIKGDERSFSCAAASIIAKVSRDYLMEELDKVFPEYGLKRNKGYPTKEHKIKIQIFGASPVHRRSFKGVMGAKERRERRTDCFPTSIEERLQYFEEKLQMLLGRN